MSFTIKTINDRRKYGMISTSFYETLAEVEKALIWFEKKKIEVVATDNKNRIVGRVIEETDNNFRMWIEPIS
jgi:hypothetical protein